MQAERVDAMLDMPKMAALWRDIAPGVINLPFKENPDFRYYGDNDYFEYVDGSILSGLVTWLNPRRIIEIGAGFSSAAMFDTLDRIKSPRLKTYTTIDPDLSRIKALNPPASAELIAAQVQSVPMERFEALEANDILFIDSSHVMKTGSDVHFEYLQILPRLKKGVIVHVHDIFYPFEYPRAWLARKPRYWNEAYIVDTMLTHGNSFEILFFVDAFVRKCGQEVRMPGDMFERFDSFEKRDVNFLSGSLWLRKT